MMLNVNIPTVLMKKKISREMKLSKSWEKMHVIVSLRKLKWMKKQEQKSIKINPCGWEIEAYKDSRFSMKLTGLEVYPQAMKSRVSPTKGQPEFPSGIFPFFSVSFFFFFWPNRNHRLINSKLIRTQTPKSHTMTSINIFFSMILKP